MKIPTNIFLLFFSLFLRSYSSKDSTIDRQALLSQAIQSVFPSSSIPLGRLSSQSRFELNCGRFEPHNLIGCCSPSDLRILHNVRIHSQTLYIYNSSKSIQSLQLPPIKSLSHQHRYKFGLKVQVVQEDFPPKECSSVFNGTLHVIGTSTIRNVYHIFADNILPLVTQILFDSILYPEFLHLPRKNLIGFHPEDSAAPHYSLLSLLMTAGTAKANENGCYSRVMWGHGPHVLYEDGLSFVRSLASDLMRDLVARHYSLPLPTAFLPHLSLNTSKFESSLNSTLTLNSSSLLAHNTPPSPSPTLTLHGRPLNIVLFTRGSSGLGRSFKGEDELVRVLNALGARATICCDFSNPSQSSLEKQLSLGYHADVVMGMHGAALAHALFSRPGVMMVELKTVYAYTSPVFAQIIEARRGTLMQVDVKGYFIKGGHRPIDQDLIARVVKVLRVGLRYEEAKVLAQNSLKHDLKRLTHLHNKLLLNQSSTSDSPLSLDLSLSSQEPPPDSSQSSLSHNTTQVNINTSITFLPESGDTLRRNLLSFTRFILGNNNKDSTVQRQTLTQGRIGTLKQPTVTKSAKSLSPHRPTVLHPPAQQFLHYLVDHPDEKHLRLLSFPEGDLFLRVTDHPGDLVLSFAHANPLPSHFNYQQFLNSRYFSVPVSKHYNENSSSLLAQANHSYSLTSSSILTLTLAQNVLLGPSLQDFQALCPHRLLNHYRTLLGVNVDDICNPNDLCQDF